MKHKSIQTLVALSLLAASCSKALPQTSETKEAIDRNSSLELLGDVGAPTYDDIHAVKSVVTPRLPWTDTYWPLTEKGLSRRWSPSDKIVGLSDFFASQTVQNKEAKVDPLLSPADKYDILFRWRHGVAIDEKVTGELVEGWKGLDTLIDMNAEVSTNKATMRNTFKEFRSAKLSAFRKQFPMSTDGWNSWLNYTSSDQYMFMDKEGSGEDWSWMGSCHGWAPAALMAETPKHSVLAKFDNREVLVTEGDIRGLLTKSWADHSPDQSQYFIGRRCNENSADPEGEIPHSASGRGYYGQITRGEAKTGFFVKAEIFASFARSNERVYPLSYDDQDGVQGFMLESYASNKTTYVLAKTLDALRLYVQTGDKTQVEVLPAVQMYGCWDVNPATFHIALQQKIGKEGLGLVMDRTRTGQVWNQPVYSADFKVGDLQEISKVPFSKTRAPGTKYVSQIKATVKWIGEPQVQHFTYTEQFNKDHSQTSKYNYVLEFDRNHRLIGGEWGTLDVTDPKQVTPDFLFGFDKGSLPVDDVANGFDFSGIVDQIHKCSLSDKVDGKMTVGDEEISYSECVLTKAP